MHISAVILSYNSVSYLDKCVHTLAADLSESNAPSEILVVDNGSTDGSVPLLQGLMTEFPGLLDVTFLDTNHGTTVSRNKALRKAKGEYIVIMDSDVEVPKGTVGALVDGLKQNPRWGIVAPKLFYPSGNFQLSTDVFPTVIDKLRRAFALKSMEQRAHNVGTSSEPMPVDYAISAFWVFRRDVLDKISGLDERIFYSPEDVDFCLRVWEAGFQVIYDPRVSAVHDAQEISRGFPFKKATFSHAMGLIYLFRKHGYAFGRTGLYKRLKRFE